METIRILLKKQAYFLPILIAMGCYCSLNAQQSYYKMVKAELGSLVKKRAAWAMQQQPITVTASYSPLSSGTRHDFFSQADYFWPDSTNPGGPFVQRDGQSNPNNFVAHRQALIRLSQVVGALASAYVIEKNNQYVKLAMAHARAWFINTATLMNPNMAYTQAVIGKSSGNSFGIIDGIHLMEVVKGLAIMEEDQAMDQASLKKIKEWFSQLLVWLGEHTNSKKERVAINNHSTCWFMQVAAFAQFTGNDSIMNVCRRQYKEVLLPNQMAADGSFPLELRRTKPYGYSIFNLDAMATLCQLLSTEKDNLWHYQTSDGRSIKKGIAFLYPYITDKKSWLYQPDVMYWNEWPVAQPAFLFGAIAFGNENWFHAWSKFDHDPKVPEVIRNLPVRNPLIWIDQH